jgi:hypothetical protein
VKRLGAVLAACSIVALPALAVAQNEPPSVSATCQPREVEVGEPFSVTLNVTVDADAPSPSDPRLPLPDALRAGSPSISNQTQISIMNGHMSRKTGISATWQVVASREGTFGIGPPFVTWNGRKLSANGMRVVVHPASPGGGQRHAAPPSNPFDPFGMFPRLPGFFDTPEQPQTQPDVSADPEIAIDQPLDQKVFLRSVVDQKNPVVGEQVTVTVYIYARSTGLELTDIHEPSIPDFYRYNLMPPHDEPEPRQVNIGGVIWRVQPIFKSALFALKSGDLEIGALQGTIVGRSNGLNATRASQPIKLHVTEPPSKGRPLGYQIGDVGSYSLSATVEPRRSEIDGAVAVTLTLSGVGNVPNSVKMPTSSAFEWLEPQVRENIDVENNKVRGSRTFAYVVRPKTAGTVDLGEATLPFWNPERKVYDIARAYLGKVEVAPGPTKSAAKDPPAPHDPWASLGKERDKLGGYKRAAEPLTERPIYWLGLFGAPFAVVVSSMSARGVRSLRSRLASRKRSTERAIDQAMAEAKSAVKAGPRAKVLGATERALYLAVERVTGLKARAILIDELPAALAQDGLAAEVAEEIRQVLAAVEAARFAPENGAGESGTAAQLFARAEKVVRQLGRMAPAVKE